MPRTDYPGLGFTEVLVPLAARTSSSGTGATHGWGHAKVLRAQLQTTAKTGTPTLDVAIEDSVDGGQTWNAIATFTQQTDVARQVINVTTPFADTLRVVWTIGGGSPNITFQVHVYAEM